MELNDIKETTTETERGEKSKKRKVGILLFLGITFLPYIFSWFTLRKGHTKLSKILSFSWLILILFSLFNNNYKVSDSKKTVVSSTQKKEKTKKKELQKKDTIKNKKNKSWIYSEYKDEMRGTSTKSAKLKSTNSHNFKFPYSGGTYLYINLRKGGVGNAAMLTVEDKKGQMMCTTGCYANIKFDNKKPVLYKLSGPADYSTNVVFINNRTSFIKNLKKSKKVIIELKFYQEGMQQFNFETKDLKF